MPQTSPALPVVSGSPRTAAHKKAEANQRLVHMVIARRFRALLSDPERHAEAFSAGYMELIGAAERFDPAQGRAFSTYACRCIEGGVLRFFRNERVQNALETCSLDAPLGDDDFTLADVIADTAPPVGAEMLARAGLAGLLSRLRSDRDRALILAIYEGGETLEAAGARIGVARGMAHHIHTKALRDLRAALQPVRTPVSAPEWASLGREAGKRRAS